MLIESAKYEVLRVNRHVRSVARFAPFANLPGLERAQCVVTPPDILGGVEAFTATAVLVANGATLDVAVTYSLDDNRTTKPAIVVSMECSAGLQHMTVRIAHNWVRDTLRTIGVTWPEAFETVDVDQLVCPCGRPDCGAQLALDIPDKVH